ncbi:MerR family transcriptional regulator [Curtobacterium sp. MCSS17_006]|uniref:MerR family transcriptional regulator n=1 Tax=unclassified Curtobacterium TaxID=257496 RepID=UPI000DA729A6|nr:MULTISPECIES: MerR family transcriptional regulator [unclassified Curtobacterium]PZE32859.1 MerR family transcriptional regulator [Curtobacterium sp. MCSS17_006]WIB33226.1 MerR family transcriptional regulator [Curtobacterium sp. MCSS17_005]
MTDDAVPTTMHIGELADRTGLSNRTIRHYDEVGLLHPSGRTEGGFRLYTDTDLTRLLIIRRMKPLGFTLEQMAELLAVVDALEAADDDADRARLRGQLDEYIRDTEERRAKLEQHLGMADEFLGILRDR